MSRCAIDGCEKQRWHNSARCVKHVKLYECDPCGVKVPREQIVKIGEQLGISHETVRQYLQGL